MTTTAEDLEDKLSKLDELLTLARSIVDYLECAETAETPADFDADVRQARSDASLLAAECDLLVKGRL